MSMTPVEKILSYGDNATRSEIVTMIKAEHGKNASKWLAGQIGKSLRTAQRWMSDKPPKVASEGLKKFGTQQKMAAHRLRKATKITRGTADVTYSRGNPQRNVPDLDIEPEMRDYLNSAAAELERGERYLAADEFGSAVLWGYAGGADRLPEEMEIRMYESGFDLRFD